MHGEGSRTQSKRGFGELRIVTELIQTWAILDPVQRAALLAILAGAGSVILCMYSRSGWLHRVHMIYYQDGTEMKIGDSVLIENGRTPGVITELIEASFERGI